VCSFPPLRLILVVPRGDNTKVAGRGGAHIVRNT
jgi:hypothetical protein